MAPTLCQQGLVVCDLGEPRVEGDVLPFLIAQNFTGNASVVLMRRTVLDATGGFDLSLRAADAQGAEDVALYLAMAERAPVGVAPAYLVGYREMPGTMSTAGGRMHRSCTIVLNRLAARRPDLPSGVFALGRMSYDLYGAGRMIAAGDASSFLRLVIRGFRRAPLLALGTLACSGLGRLAETLRADRRRPRFDDLTPEERYAHQPLQRWLEQRRARLVEDIVAEQDDHVGAEA